MFDLYDQGLGTHAIANKTGRSTHTVHSVLTHRAAPGRCPSGTQRPPMKGLLVVRVAVAGEADVEIGTTPVRLTGSRI